MASTAGTAPYVQNTFFDNWLAAYPGQLRTAQDYIGNVLRTYIGEGDLVMGRAVVKGTTNTSTIKQSQIPFTVQEPQLASVAADFVGVLVRPQVTTTNITDENGDVVAGYPDNSNAAVAECDSHIIIAVLVRTNVSEIVDGEAVYTAVNPTNDPDIEVGEFANDSGGVTGLIALPNVVWYGNVQFQAPSTVGFIKLSRLS